jgi:hypothetical protein
MIGYPKKTPSHMTTFLGEDRKRSRLNDSLAIVWSRAPSYALLHHGRATGHSVAGWTFGADPTRSMKVPGAGSSAEPFPECSHRQIRWSRSSLSSETITGYGYGRRMPAARLDERLSRNDPFSRRPGPTQSDTCFEDDGGRATGEPMPRSPRPRLGTPTHRPPAPLKAALTSPCRDVSGVARSEKERAARFSRLNPGGRSRAPWDGVLPIGPSPSGTGQAVRAARPTGAAADRRCQSRRARCAR